MGTEKVTFLILMVISRLRHTPEIHHSEEAGAYASTAYTARLHQADVRLSMAEIGAAWQNGYAERLMCTIKEEEVDLSEYEDYTDATRQLGHFLDEVMHKRIHSSLGYLTLAEFEEDWSRKPPPVPVEQKRETESHQRKEERIWCQRIFLDRPFKWRSRQHCRGFSRNPLRTREQPPLRVPLGVVRAEHGRITERGRSMLSQDEGEQPKRENR
jgi:hypothetical protein